MKRLRIAPLILAVAALMSVCAMAENYGISVRLDAISSNISEVIDFGEYAPVQINSRTYVHTRGFAEAAGMKVTWDQENQTAFIKIMADAASDKPIERYAAGLFDTLSDKAPGTASNITVSLRLNDSRALLRYNYDIGDGHVAGLGRTVEMDGAAYMENDSALMVPLRGLMEAFGFEVGWEQETLTASVAIPGEVTAGDTEELDYWIPGGGYVPEHEIGEYLGSYRITKYCPCNICNGGWGPYTAWADEIIVGQTIGVNPAEIPPLTWVYIDGIGWRRAEDTGGGIGTHHIDLAVSTHYEATHNSIGNRDVWLAK